MPITIYFFSGTGNSYKVAKDIANGVQGNLIPIHTLVDKDSIAVDSEAIGLVFPVYYVPFGGLPEIVKNFAYKLQNIRSKYIFTVCTYGSAEAGTLRTLNKILESKGGKSVSRFTVNMPENIHPHLAINKHKKMYEVWEDNVGKVCNCILTRKHIKLDLPNTVAGRTYKLLNLVAILIKHLFRNLAIKELQEGAHSSSRIYAQLIRYIDKSFTADEKCTGCRTCAKICPARNIEFINNRPSWLHHCEYCLACYNWCPQEAIQSSILKNTLRYHHPDVKTSDLIVRKH